MKRISVCGESGVPRARSSPSSDSRNRRVRQARADPVSVRDPWPVTRPAASRMRAVSEVNGTITPPNGSAATIARSAGVSCGEQPVDRAPEELFAAGDEGLLIDDEDEPAAGGDVVVRAVGRRHARGVPRRRRRRGRDPSQRAHRSYAIGDRGFRRPTAADRRSGRRRRPGRRSRRSDRPGARSRSATGCAESEVRGLVATAASPASDEERGRRRVARACLSVQLPASSWQLPAASSSRAAKLGATSWTTDYQLKRSSAARCGRPDRRCCSGPCRRRSSGRSSAPAPGLATGL